MEEIFELFIINGQKFSFPEKTNMCTWNSKFKYCAKFWRFDALLQNKNRSKNTGID